MKKFPESENYSDLISMSRPLIHEPDLPKLWKSGDISPAHLLAVIHVIRLCLTVKFIVLLERD